MVVGGGLMTDQQGSMGAEGMIDGLAKFNARSVTVAQSVSTLKRDG